MDSFAPDQKLFLYVLKISIKTLIIDANSYLTGVYLLITNINSWGKYFC